MSSWADEDGDVLPPTETTTEGGVKTIVEYKFNMQRQVVKVTSKFRVQEFKTRKTEGMKQRRLLPKFGEAAGQEHGFIDPACTQTSVEVIRLENPNAEVADNTQDLLDSLAAGTMAISSKWRSAGQMGMTDLGDMGMGEDGPPGSSSDGASASMMSVGEMSEPAGEPSSSDIAEVASSLRSSSSLAASHSSGTAKARVFPEPVGALMTASRRRGGDPPEGAEPDDDPGRSMRSLSPAAHPSGTITWTSAPSSVSTARMSPATNPSGTTTSKAGTIGSRFGSASGSDRASLSKPPSRLPPSPTPFAAECSASARQLTVAACTGVGYRKPSFSSRE